MANIVERGRIYFFYRPRVQHTQAKGFQDVQRLQMILSSTEQKLYRIVIIGHKQMPNPAEAGRAKFWGYVERVSRDPDPIKQELSGEIYQTKTRGERYQPASRPAGEGLYAFVDHGPHMHFIYELELPKKIGPVQRDLNIEREASYIMAIKDPDIAWPPEDVRFAAMKDPAALNQEGMEIVLISASSDVSRELGIDMPHDEQDLESSHLFEDLRLHEADHPTEPLIHGVWA
jgi:hypothetical protein